jgi:hypothetical protein
MPHRLFAVVLFLFVSFISTGQFQKGDRMVGATIGSAVFNTGNADISVASIGSNTSKTNSYAITVNPSIGWFITSQTVAGFSLTINPTNQKTTFEQNGSTYQSDKSANFNIGFGGFARNYFSAKKGNSLLPFGQLSLNGGISNLKTEGFFYGGSGASSYKQTYSGHSSGGFYFNTSFSAGFTKMVSAHTGLDFYLGYNFAYNKNIFKRTTLRDDGIDGSIDTRAENETTTKFSNHGLMIGVGFQVFLEPRKK